jgi:hypothetical protein
MDFDLDALNPAFQDLGGYDRDPEEYDDYEDYDEYEDYEEDIYEERKGLRRRATRHDDYDY